MDKQADSGTKSQAGMTDPGIEELLEYLYVVRVEKDTPDETDIPAGAAQAAIVAGLVEGRGGELFLTEEGQSAARDVVRRHRLAECLLRDVLGVHDSAVEADACVLEHIIQHGLDDRICTLLGHPANCPHGKPIPRGECCQKARRDSFKDVAPMSEGTVGAEGTVAYLQTRDRRDVQKLMALGILPGVHIQLIRRSPSYVFQLGYSQFTIDRELAEKICVRWNR